MFMLQQPVPVEGVPALEAGVGYVGQLAVDPDTDEVYVKVGDAWTKLVDANGEPIQMTVTSAQITDATTVGRAVLTAADAGAARTAIGAGTSSLALGTSGTTAMAGNTSASAIQAPAFTTAGGTAIPAGTVAAQLKAIADLADPAGP